MKKIIRPFLILGVSLFAIHCSDVKFAETKDAAKQGNLGGDDAGGTIGQPDDPNNPNPTPTPGPGPTPTPGPSPTPTPTPGPGPTPTPTPGPTPTPPAEYPKVSFYGPTCIRGSNCLVQFTLDRAYVSRVDFDWRTNDTIYQTPATPIWGQPGVHYVSTNGHIQFSPGQTQIQVYVQNINPYNVPINIGVIMSNCKYGGRADSCKQYFNQ